MSDGPAFRGDRAVFDHLHHLFDKGHLHLLLGVLLGVLLDSVAEGSVADLVDSLYHSEGDHYYCPEFVKTAYR